MIDNLADIRLVRERASGEFVGSVCDQFARRGALSPKQWAAVNRIADDIRKPKIVLDFAAIIVVFEVALAAGLKYPKVALLTALGNPVVLSRAGNQARLPGTINVTDGGPYGDNKWYGRIEMDGTFKPSRDCPDDVVTLLQEFSDDPVSVAAAYGKITGNCCFCRRKLTDQRSTDVGYGPVCAERFGLAWGSRQSRAFEAAFDCDKVVA